MGKIQLTPEQAAAVENRGGALIVSAAAGSGKTKVLVERLFRYVTQERCSVDDFLIITYTRAAAAELRGKIAEELNRRIAEAPDNVHLQRQMLRVYQADIKTVDAFCTALLRENAHLLGQEGEKRCLTPDFRVMDEDEAALVRQRVLSRVLERFYSHIDPAGELLADTLGAGRDDQRLEELVDTLYAKLQSHAEPERWIQEQTAFWRCPGDDIDQTPYAKEILSGVARKAAYWQEMLTAMAERMGDNPAVEKGYGPGFSAAAEALGRLARAAGESWSEAAGVQVEFPRLGSVKADAGGGLKEQAKALWDACKKDIPKMTKVLRTSSQEAMEDLQAVAPAMVALLQLTAEFSAAYQQEKLRLNAADFSDQEHLALKLLIGPDGTPTELGSQVAGRYQEIMVDEYQDTNEVQNCIFSAVSKQGRNLFTVGDVKQSIYRFRLADPTIFLEKYQRYLPADQADDGQERKILLSRNFRSRKEVLEGTNFIFEQIMSPQMGEMEYGEAEKLYCGAEYYLPREDCAVEFHLVDMELRRGKERPFKRTLAEAQAIARRIRSLLSDGFQVQDGEHLRPCRMEDIVVLMRSPSGRAFTLSRALEELGIPCSADAAADFFATMEVAVIYNFLQIIDNPRQDVPLISVLRSPLFGFTPDRLAQIRANGTEGEFYDALCADGGEDCRQFLAGLSQLRRLAQDVSVHRLLFHLYNRCHAFGIFGAMEGGEERKENLIALFEHARRFEASGYRGGIRLRDAAAPADGSGPGAADPRKNRFRRHPADEHPQVQGPGVPGGDFGRSFAAVQPYGLSDPGAGPSQDGHRPGPGGSGPADQVSHRGPAGHRIHAAPGEQIRGDADSLRGHDPGPGKADPILQPLQRAKTHCRHGAPLLVPHAAGGGGGLRMHGGLDFAAPFVPAGGGTPPPGSRGAALCRRRSPLGDFPGKWGGVPPCAGGKALRFGAGGGGDAF